jgi:hypothetical protein
VIKVGTDTTWQREAVEASPDAAAVPLRRVIGPSPATGRWSKLALSAIAGVGWVVAGALVFGGGYMLWHLLFGDSVGGDVWLGQPPAWVEQQAAGSDDDLPGGVPWSPDMIDRTTIPGGGTVPPGTAVDASSSTSTTVSTMPASSGAVTTITVAQAPVVQSPSGGATATTVRPAAPVTTVRPPSTTVATTTTATTVATTTATTVANTVTSTTVSGTSTTDVTSATVDDASSTTVDDGDDSSGRGRGGSGGGGGDD